MAESAPRTPARELVLSAIANAKLADRMMKAAVERTFQPNLISGKSAEQIARQAQSLLADVSPHHVSHNVLRRIERAKLSVNRSISFTTQMHEMSEARNLGVLRPSWKLDAKNAAYHFVDAIGARRPWSDKHTYKWADAPREYPSVIKATRGTGSRGVYLLYSPDRIVHAKDGKELGGVAQMDAHAHKLMSSQRPIPDRWMVEELILEDSQRQLPARDLKFYVFYGEVMLVQESRRDEGLQVAFWDADGSPTTTGRYEDVPLDGVGFTAEEAELVADISRSIPHQFMRIDMLKSEDGLVVGEFTPRPGSFDLFTREWDRKLGEAWLRAESRLYRDMLEGKSFKPFLDATQLLD